MLRPFLAALGASVLICGGCAHRAARFSNTVSVDEADVGKRPAVFSEDRLAEEPASGGAGAADSGGIVLAAPRYVALRHKMQLLEPGAELPKSVEAVVAFCGTIQCEVLSSTVINDTDQSNPSGNISMRVAPSDLEKLLDFAGKHGKVVQHNTESEDKTASVIDVEAKLKNLTEFRDNLRRMLTKPNASVADLVSIQEKLSETQAALDGEATMRKVLANETEKVAVEIDFRAESKPGSRRGVFAPIGQALRDSGAVLSESLAALITAVAAMLPWLIFIVPGAWLLVRLWRKVRRKRSAAAAVAAPAG